MSKLDEFKSFVKNNPKLIKFVENKEMTWQKFYEMYDLYGEDKSVWDKYLVVSAGTVSGFKIADALGFLKKMDLENVQEGINSVQRVLGVFGEMGKKEDEKEDYKPRPIYKHFED
ncbi:MAG: spore coat protein YlbD [Mycoplasmatota bacterium]